MTDTIEFPTIDAAAIAAPVASAATQVAVVAPDATKIDLAKIDLEAVALAHFEASRAALAVATEKLTGVVHDLSTAGKLADAKSLRHRLINIPLADARKVSTSLKSKLTATSKAVGATLVSIESGFEAADALITPQIEARDAELEAERQRKEAEAAARREKFGGLLSNIRGYGTAAKGLPAARILAGIAYVEDLTFGPEWEEYASQAAQAQGETLAVLRALHAEALAAEQAEAMRLENERKAAEIAAQQRAVALAQRRMDDIRGINARCADVQAAIVGKPAALAVALLETFVSTTAATDVSTEAFGDLAPMAEMAQSMVLAQLRSMLAEAQARAEHERQAKQAAEDLAAARAQEEMAEAARAAEKADAPVEIIDAEVHEKPERDQPDLQTAEIPAGVTNHDTACADAVAWTPVEIEPLNEPATEPEGIADFHRASLHAIEAGGRSFLSHVTTEAIATNEVATLKLGAIGDRLGFNLTAAFVADTLGIPARATDKAAKLYYESDFTRICDALVEHIGGVVLACEVRA